MCDSTDATFLDSSFDREGVMARHVGEVGIK